MRVPYLIIILQNDVTLLTLAFLNERTRGAEGSLLFWLFLNIFANACKANPVFSCNRLFGLSHYHAKNTPI